MKTHIFTNHCINFEELLNKTTLEEMLEVVVEQAKTDEAKQRMDLANWMNYKEEDWCPAYFGMFVEWLAQHWLNYFGPTDWNIHGVDMGNSVGNNDEDYGIDGTAYSIKVQRMASTGRIAQPGSPVFLQVKGSTNKHKKHSPNDGSRLPNFCTNAMSTAIVGGHALQTRYVLFTTAAGISHTMEKMCMRLIEVIAYEDISKKMDNNPVFLNMLREAVGLDKIPVPAAKIDADAALIWEELELDGSAT